MTTIVFYDTETTGLNVKTERIIEIGMRKCKYTKQVGYWRRTDISNFDTLVKTNHPISKGSSAIHGITPRAIRRKPFFKDISQKIVDICPANTVLCSYNGKRFDDPILHNELERSGFELDEGVIYLDLIKIVRHIFPMLLSYKLVDVLEELGIEGDNSHRTFDDVLCLQKLFDRCLCSFSSPKEMIELEEKLNGKHGKYWTHKDKFDLLNLYSKHIKDNVDPHESMRVIRNTLFRSHFAVLKQLRVILSKHSLLPSLENYVKTVFINSIYKDYLLKGVSVEDLAEQYEWSGLSISRYLDKCFDLGFPRHR